MTKAQTVRETLKSLKIKRTDVNVTVGSGSSKEMAIITIRKNGFYSSVKKLFGSDSMVHISCSNSLMN